MSDETPLLTPASLEVDAAFEFAQPGHTQYGGGFSKDGSPHVTDEVFNAASHLVGALLAILGTGVLVAKSSVDARPWHIVSFAVYGLATVCLFLASFLHHGVHCGRADEGFKVADYLFIYLMIAGTFTPMCLIFLNHCWIGWTFFGVIWGQAILGSVLQLCLRHKMPKWVSMTFYGFLGGIGVVYAMPLYSFLGPLGVGLLAAGGAVYVAGACVFVLEEPNPFPGKFGFHEIWHLCVLLGAILHWVLMYLFVEPYNGDGTCPKGW